MEFKLSEREELLRKSMREFAEKEIPRKDIRTCPVICEPRTN